MFKIPLTLQSSEIIALHDYLVEELQDEPMDIQERMERALLIEILQKLVKAKFQAKEKTKLSLSYPQAAALWLNTAGKQDTGDHTNAVLISLSLTIHPKL